jgi:O-antigen/teichoic acid export membrane protein
VLNLVLIPHYGLEGAAAATAVSLVFASIWLFIAVRRRLGISAFIFTSSRA